MKKLLLISVMLSLFFMLIGQAQDETKDTIAAQKSTENIKKGWNFGILPDVAFDPDVGFRYGALTNIYYYGDGSRYPQYDHSLYLEWSRTTKGSGTKTFTWDSDRLIPGIRSFFEASYLTEQALDFYGFNGYKVVYDADIEKSTDVDGFKNRLFYKHERNLLRLNADFQGEIIGHKFRWLAGIGYMGNYIAAVDVDELNEGKVDTDQLSSESLYKNYIDWGIIKADQANGGGHTLLKGGLVYDTRDNEPNPFSGIWTEMQIHYLPSFLSTTDYSWARLVLTHRQYFTIIPDIMNFAYRLSYQTTIFGEMPFYMMPYFYNTAPKNTTDGVGGSKTVRGVLRNRIVGEGVAFANLEVRYKIVRTQFLKQNFYIALSGFLDAGMVTKPYELPDDLLTLHPEATDYFDLGAKEVPHFGLGLGLHFVLNQNFIVAVDFGSATNTTDGKIGVNMPYIGLNYLF